MQKIGIIGLGNIGKSLVLGFSACSQYNFFIYDKNRSNVEQQIDSKYIIKQKSNEDVISECSIIILCIRTSQVENWMGKYNKYLDGKILVLMQSGISLNGLQEYSKNINIIRVISNINISEQKGHSVVLDQGTKDIERVLNIFNYLGDVIKVKNERELDAVSLLTGCTPAFIGLVLSELLITYDDVPLQKKDILDILYNTISNSLDVMNSSSLTPNEYTESTCTKNGSLEECINNLKKLNISSWLNPLKDTLKRNTNENIKK